VKVFKFTMSNGDQIVSLVNEDCIPVDGYSSYYITSELYLDNHSVNTMEKRVYELKFFLEWIEHNDIDIIDRVECGTFLTDAEIYRFVDTAKIKCVERFQGADNVVQLNITDKRVSDAITSTTAVKQRVSANTTNERINTAANYIEFLSGEIHTGIMPEAAVNKLYRTTKLLKKSKLRISNHASSDAKYDGFNAVLPDDTLYRMLNIIALDSVENPFKHSRKRNQLIIEILASTGIRRGALSKLKITDIDFTGKANRLNIRRTPEDPNDPRKNKPQQKTRAHTTYINPVLVVDIAAYIDVSRAKIPQASKHEFVFISEINTKGTLGAPLSNKSVDYIFDVLSKTLKTRITPHMLRHKWNEIFTDKTAHLPDAEADKRRIDSMGWEKTTVMPERYNHYKNLQKAYEAQQQIQQAIFEKKDEE
jgi:integrase